jgi:hypothetical protein
MKNKINPRGLILLNENFCKKAAGNVSFTAQRAKNKARLCFSYPQIKFELSLAEKIQPIFRC